MFGSKKPTPVPSATLQATHNVDAEDNLNELDVRSATQKTHDQLLIMLNGLSATKDRLETTIDDATRDLRETNVLIASVNAALKVIDEANALPSSEMSMSMFLNKEQFLRETNHSPENVQELAKAVKDAVSNNGK